ncbi:MAG: hypothetical protein RDU41_08805 [Clostridia bacterium]|nr:hypothetical protein [Clostridia bacterium]
MLYMGTVVLGMPEESFWRITPRKLMALIRVHNQIHSPGEDSGPSKKPASKSAVGKLASW